jgi:predicted amidohydrolase
MGLQLKKDRKNQEKNIQNLEKVALKKKNDFPWIDLVFTGELYLQESDSITTAQILPNDLTNRLGNLAKKLACWFVPGSFYEKVGSEVYNTLLVFNPDGEVVVKYRKIYPWLPHEKTNYGEEFVTFDIPDIGRIGVVICYDIWFPEIFRTLTWMGAEVILQPSLTHTPDRSAEQILAQAHAIMFQCYVLNVNAISQQGGGESIFVDPEGKILQQAGTHEMVMTEVIDLDKVSWIRQFGSYGTNPLWKSFRDSKVQGNFPPYHRLKDGEIFKQLGDLKHHKDVRKWE